MRAHTPRDLLHHVINALEALAPPSLRPLQRADFVFGALLVPAAAPQVAIAPAAAFAAAGAVAGYDSEATIADSIATLRDE